MPQQTRPLIIIRQHDDHQVPILRPGSRRVRFAGWPLPALRSCCVFRRRGSKSGGRPHCGVRWAWRGRQLMVSTSLPRPAGRARSAGWRTTASCSLLAGAAWDSSSRLSTSNLTGPSRSKSFCRSWPVSPISANASCVRRGRPRRFAETRSSPSTRWARSVASPTSPWNYSPESRWKRGRRGSRGCRPPRFCASGGKSVRRWRNRTPAVLFTVTSNPATSGFRPRRAA